MKRLLLAAAALTLLAAPAYAQKGVAFTASADHATLVTKYQVRIDQNEAQKVLKDIGKPTPDSTNTITYLDATLFSSLAPGDYKLYAIAVGTGGSSYSTPTPFSIAAPTTPPAPPGPPTPVPNDPGTADDIVLYAAQATAASGNWKVVADLSAAGGAAIYNADAGVPKITTVPVPPTNYFDIPFSAHAGIPYHVWFRMRADRDSYVNDSVYVQFSAAQDATGLRLAPIGTAAAQTMTLEEGTNAGVSGWGWNDWNYGGTAANVYFTEGPQMLRVLQREDGPRIDQIVISSNLYIFNRPGRTKTDTTILPKQP